VAAAAKQFGHRLFAAAFIRLGKRDQPVVARQAALLQRRVVPLQAIFRIGDIVV
jgi:hypothetical protein